MIKEIKLKKIRTCEIHDGNEKNLYCNSEGCKFALCAGCFMDGHLGHKKVRLADVFEGNKRKVHDCMELFEKNTNKLEVSVEALDKQI